MLKMTDDLNPAKERVEIHRKMNQLIKNRMTLPDPDPRRDEINLLLEALGALLELYKQMEINETDWKKNTG